MKPSSKWTFITAVAVTLIICATAVFISFQYSQTQKDIAKQNSEGLHDIGVGICQTREYNFQMCSE